MNRANNQIHVTHIASGDLWAGAEVQLYTLCKSLNKMENITVSVILLNHGMLEDKLREQNIPVEVLDESSANSLQIFLGLIKSLKKLSPDIVHTHRIKENILGSLAAKLAGNIPSLRTAHGAPEHKPSPLKPYKYLMHILDWITARFLQLEICAVSDDLKALLEKTYPPKKIQVIENGVDIEELTPYTTQQPPKEYNKSNAFKIGLIGRLVPVKRVDLFIKTAKYIHDNYPELSVHFHIYGDGPLDDELKQLADSLEVSDIIKFEGHCDDIHKQMASLNALLITSDHEGLPMTLLEAMALGVPVIAHSVGGITKACQDGKCCRLTEQTTEQFAHSLIEQLAECESASRVKLAQTRVKLFYSANANAESFLLRYRALS